MDQTRSDLKIIGFVIIGLKLNSIYYVNKQAIKSKLNGLIWSLSDEHVSSKKQNNWVLLALGIESSCRLNRYIQQAFLHFEKIQRRREQFKQNHSMGWITKEANT